MKALPRGIRKHGAGYQASVQVQGKRKAVTCETLEQAIEARETLRKQLEGLIPSGIIYEGMKHKKAPEKAKVWTIKEAGDYCLEHHWKNKSSEGHYIRQVRHVKELCKFFGEGTRVDVITSQMIDEYISYLETLNISDSTINRRLSTVSKILSEAYDLGITQAKPKVRFRNSQGGRELAFLTDSDLERCRSFIKAIGDVDFSDVFEVLLGTGFRPAELGKVKVRHIDFDIGKHGVINLWGDTVTKKHQRSVPMTKQVSEIMKRRVANLGCDEYALKVSKRWLRDWWAHLRSHMNRVDDKDFTPYILRHTCATNLARKGTSAFVLMKWMGHRNIQTSMRYVKMFAVDLFDVVD